MSCDECPICLEQLDESRSRLVECGHVYHFECIRRWHQQSQDLKCPTCRRQSRHLEQIISNVKVDIQEYSAANRVISEVSHGFSNLALESEDRRRSWTLRSLECGICGILNSEIGHYCTACYTAYHGRCLRTLQAEVGEIFTNLFCCNCHEAFANSNHDDSARSRTIQPFLLPHARSRPSSEATRPNGDRSEVDESWMLLSRLRAQARIQAISSHKQSIQQHVRSALHSHYDGVSSGCKVIDKKQFTDINKLVSRRLYRMSGYIYCPQTINYDNEAQRLIREELSRLCTET
ncbi:LAFA_0G10374g1_1 [Lachancea sp. 'fantastica']|nr:LAFA_0G10374g1_1 [Lachancea sp. 'fantastica']